MSFTDMSPGDATSLWYRIILVDIDGAEAIAGPIFISLDRSPRNSVLYTPGVSRCDRPIPIRYRVGVATVPISLQIFSVQGGLIRTLMREPAGSGKRVCYWDQRVDTGVPVSSGIYFVRLAAERTLCRKLVLAQ